MAIADLSMKGIVAVSQTAAWWPFLQVCSLPCASATWLAVALARRLRHESTPADSSDLVDAVAARATT
jgi:hypothetical protein